MKNNRGQAMTEMMFLVPLFVMIIGGVMAVVYMCWQGIKVQQAANIAARIQGQERVAGGVAVNSIRQDNGTYSGGDIDPSTYKNLDAQTLASLEAIKKHTQLPPNTVYGKIQRVVRAMFGPGEQDGLFIPMPHYGVVGNTDQVKVVRSISFPNVLNLQLDPVTVVGTAYGGEDTHQYGLVRWGNTLPGGNQKFWSETDSQGHHTNLPNPNND